MKNFKRYIYYLLNAILLRPANVLAAELESNKADLDFNSFLFGKQILFGTFLGFLIGFTIKKSLKILLFAAGVIFIIMIFLSKEDLLVIKWSRFEEIYNNFINTYDFSAIINKIYNWFSESITVTGSFGVGFFIGLKTG